MSSADKDLSNVPRVILQKGNNFKIGIVRSLWNEEVTGNLYNACKIALHESGIDPGNIISLEVPGSFELPIGAKMLMSKHKLEAVICLGCVIKGETDHDVYISQAVAQGLTQLSLLSGVPVIFGVLTTNNQEQAVDRSGGKHGNKGTEAAYTALHMLKLKHDEDQQKPIGF